MFGFTFATKLKGANYKSHRNILVFCNQWNLMSDLNMSHEEISGFISLSLFGFTLVIKLKFLFWKSLKYYNIFNKKNKWRQIWICPMENVWFCFNSIAWVHFHHKIDICRFRKSLKYFIFLCPAKECLIWFKLHCLKKFWH